MKNVAMAVVAHPDDIELMMAGTLLQLKRAGYQIHYLNVANGCCGTATMGREKIIAVRTEEAKASCKRMGAVFHEPLVDDLQIYYTPALVARMCAVMRQVQPEVLLVQSPHDYMEDHTISARLAVTASFCRGMLNFVADPPVPMVGYDMAVYHALPWGLHDQLRRPVSAHFYVDIAPVLKDKREALGCHLSQKQWLDESQGLDSYLNTMEEMSAAIGKQSGRFKYAEGWHRHLHLGYGPEDFDPIGAALGKLVVPAPTA